MQYKIYHYTIYIIVNGAQMHLARVVIVVVCPSILSQIFCFYPISKLSDHYIPGTVTNNNVNNDDTEIKYEMKGLFYDSFNIFLKFKCIEACRRKPSSPTKQSLNVMAVS